MTCRVKRGMQAIGAKVETMLRQDGTGGHSLKNPGKARLLWIGFS